MNWLLDIGNSFCKYAKYDNRMDNPSCVPTDELIDRFSELFLMKSECNTFFISNVAGREIERALQAFADDDTLIHFAQSDCKDTEITTAYDQDKLGVDRFVSLISAWHQLKRSCIVIDCGTVSTVDYLDHLGVHKGGIIFPSFKVMLSGLSNIDSLNQYIRKISHTDIGECANLSDIVATDTQTAILQGSFYTMVGTLKEVILRMREFGDADAPVLITGGAADTVFGHLKEACIVNHLVLKGLIILFKLEEAE